MNEDRDTAQTRENIDRTARNWRDLNHKMGNTSMTHTQARERVVSARTAGDLKRDNGNR